jgi:hypothetical protein
MDTRNLFLCKVCALPIRNKDIKKADPGFVCDKCEVCWPDRRAQMRELKNDLLDQLCRILERLYRYYNQRNDPPPELMAKIREGLAKQSNPADDTLEAISKSLKSGASGEDLLRQVSESERTLAGFFYLSGERMTHVNSNTVLRHWVALVQRMRDEVDRHRHSGTVLRAISKPRYELGLARLSRLIGDNPVVISRDLGHYTTRKRADHILGKGTHDHIPQLIRQTAHMNPRISSRDLGEILRFAGNAAFITEHDDVIEFRSKERDRLCKYLLADEILIIIDDLWFLEGNRRRGTDRTPAELVTIYPKRLAAKQLTKDLTEKRYLPNCVNLRELTKFVKELQL